MNERWETGLNKTTPTIWASGGELDGAEQRVTVAFMRLWRRRQHRPVVSGALASYRWLCQAVKTR